MTWFPFLLYICLMLHSGLCTESPKKIVLYSNSVASMVKLLQMENNLIESLESYSKDMPQKLDMIRLFQEILKRPSMHSSEMQEEYVANPLNAFALIRRLQQDWPKWLAYLEDVLDKSKIEEMQQQLEQAPSEKDLQIAAAGLLRIESYYDLEASHMAKGLLLDKQYDSSLDSADCVALGDYLFNRTKYSRSTHWYRTAIRRYQKPYLKLYRQVLGLKRKKLYRKYAQAIVHEPDISEEPSSNETDPEWKNMAEKYMKQLVAEANSDNIRQLVEEYLAQDEQAFIDLRARYKARPTAVERGCRGLWEKRQPHRLTCRYVSENSAYLKLAPLKMETLNLQPIIELYHDVLYDREIKALQNLTTEEEETHDDKSSVKSFLLKDGNSPIISSLNRRVADMFGIDIAKNKPLHLLNFGLGGHLGQQKCQGPNSKSCKKQMKFWRRNRIATIIFYASTVQLGGATIFPKLQLEVKPKRGSALLWYNWNEAAKVDALAKHAVCPVVLGSRWAITKCLDAQQQQEPQKLCLA